MRLKKAPRVMLKKLRLNLIQIKQTFMTVEYNNSFFLNIIFKSLS